MKILATAGYLKLFRDFKLAHMIKTYRSASCHQVKDQRALHMLHGIMSEQEYCLYSRESVSERMNIFYLFTDKSIVIGV